MLAAPPVRPWGFVLFLQGGSPTPPCLGPLGLIRGVVRTGGDGSGVPTAPVGKWLHRLGQHRQRWPSLCQRLAVVNPPGSCSTIEPCNDEGLQR